MTTLRTAAQQALEALEFDGFTPDDPTHRDYTTKAITDLRAALAEPTAEDIAQEWDLLQETQAALRDAWAILKKLKAVQDAARKLVESDPDSAADTEGEAFTAWCALVAAIDDADTLLCEFGESHE